jgi:hypothetical protein
MATFYLKYRDTRPQLEITLKNPDLSVHDLTGATASLHVYVESTVFTRAMTVDAVPTTGIVRYTWQATDWTVGTPVLIAGRWKMEVEVINGTARTTFPNDPDNPDWLLVGHDIGQA